MNWQKILVFNYALHFPITSQMNCVDVCANKHVRVNHKMMSVYMEVQPLMMQKRMEEMEKLNPPVEQPTSETPVISDTPVVTEAPISSETSVEQSSSSVSANLNNSVETPVAS